MRTINCALIGLGKWGTVLKPYIIPENGFKLVKIYSSKNKADSIYTSCLDDIGRDNKIEAVFICTPIKTHADLVSYFIENNKHIFCEKPLSATVEIAKKLVKMADDKQVNLLVDYTFCFSPSINKMEKLINSIGKIRFIDAEFMQFGHFYNDDIFSVIGIHWIAVISKLIKSELSVESVIPILYYNNEIVCANAIYTSGECKINLMLSLVSERKSRCITIYGDEGILAYDMQSKETVKKIMYNDFQNPSIESWSFNEEDNLKIAVKYFYNLILGKNNEIDVKKIEYTLYKTKQVLNNGKTFS